MKLQSRRKRPHQHHFTELGIYVFESRHSDAFTMELDKWDFHKLCAIVQGSGFLETGTATIPIGANQLLYLPAHEAHRFRDKVGDPLTLVMVCFYDRTFSSNAAAFEVFSLFQQHFPALLPFDFKNNYSRVRIKNSFRTMLVEQQQRKEGSAAALWCQLVQLLLFLVRINREQQKQFSADPRTIAFTGSIHFIDNNFHRPIKVEELAAMANLSYRRYTDQFKRNTGKTVTEYLTAIRIEYAKHIMIETEDIMYAALESGFGDLAHFYRVFKKHTGSTPKRFIADRKPRLQPPAKG
jgi:AraC-like DNA-binding protein